MDFKDQIKQLGDRVAKMLPQIQTEEATKTSLTLPFIQILGYDIFNPAEVNPEFVADLGIKKGEKVDYAIMKNGEPILLIECKHHQEKLDPHNSQLFRYFHTTKAKFGLLTNGLHYRFYTDLVEPNKMDEKPFFEFILTDIKEAEIDELKKFHKSYFDIESIFTTASELKYSSEIKAVLSAEFKEPTEDFVRFFISKVYDGKATAKIVSQFTGIVKKSINQLVSDMINDRLKAALAKEAESEKQRVAEEALKPEEDEKAIETTALELEGYMIVKSILRKRINIERVVGRDTKTYYGILLDDNNRKPLCRLWLNGNKKYLGLFDGEKNETRHEIVKLDDIFNHSDQLLKSIDLYEKEESITP
ncbi:MAG TPA: type I restriction endonuclease [Ohtaekwangia sp.]|uniref:type I restriction endonuclease n=1 Tax=Ohtaekwangia sp. TaxID=2066019 RepID=UPI002F92F2B7